MKLSLCGGHERAAAEAEAPRLIAAAMKQHEQNGQIQDWGSQAFAAFCAVEFGFQVLQDVDLGF